MRFRPQTQIDIFHPIAHGIHYFISSRTVDALSTERRPNFIDGLSCFDLLDGNYILRSASGDAGVP